MATKLGILSSQIIRCEKCPRLRRYCRKVAQEKRRAFLHETYWGKPVPGIGDPKARLMLIGLAPAAHGGNRTGRMFTGDRSGDWLYGALYRAGFANQPNSTDRNDGLELTDAYVTATVRCAPPDNKPRPIEITRCSGYLEEEIQLLTNARVYLALGKLAWDESWKTLTRLGMTEGRRPPFHHAASLELPGKRWLIASYHPSQQNTFTGKLTQPMFDSVFNHARKLLAGKA